MMLLLPPVCCTHFNSGKLIVFQRFLLHYAENPAKHMKQMKPMLPPVSLWQTLVANF